MTLSTIETVGSRETCSEALATLRDNARQASTDKERGDRWMRSHGCVVSLPSKTTNEDYGATVFLPADSARYVAPYKPDPAREMAFSRHATGANPRIVIALVNEIERLRAALSTTPVAETAGEAVDEGAAGEGLYLTKGVLARLRALSCHSSLGPLGMDELRQALAARAHPSPTPAADADRVREIVVKAVKAAMKDAWEDHATDTGCWPADIKRVSARGPLRLTFTPAIWAQTTAEWAAETVLASLQPEEK